MLNIVIKGTLLLWLLILVPSSIHAGAPGGHYDNQFTAQKGLWDLSGNYSETDASSSATMTVVQDDKGKLTGTFTITFTSPQATVNVKGPITGSIKTTGGVPKVSVSIKLTGTGSNGVQTAPVTGTLTLTLGIDQADNELTGTYTLNTCVKAPGSGCNSKTGSQQLDLPAGMDGTWDLITDIQNTNGKLGGKASALLSNGRTLPLSLQVQYVSMTDLTKLTLKGSAGTATIQAKAAPGALMLQTMTAQLLGQMVTVP